MRRLTQGLVLLAVQATLVAGAAGKYLWERHTRPMLWVKASPLGDGPFASPSDVNDRYRPVQLTVDVCGLPPKPAEQETDFSHPPDAAGTYVTYPARKGFVRTVAKDGRLAAVDVTAVYAHNAQDFLWDLRKPCTEAWLRDPVHFYVPKGIRLPDHLKPNESLWGLVTVPAEGPPRPVELAVSDATGFHALQAGH